MALMDPVEFIIKLPHIESVNSMYEPNFKLLSNGKSVFSGLRLSDATSKMKNEIIHQVDAKRINIKNIDLNYPFRLQIIFILNKNIMKRDLDNFQKLTQDGIFTSLRLNDSRIFEIKLKKLLYTQSSNEFIKVKLEQIPEKIDSMIVG